MAQTKIGKAILASPFILILHFSMNVLSLRRTPRIPCNPISAISLIIFNNIQNFPPFHPLTTSQSGTVAPLNSHFAPPAGFARIVFVVRREIDQRIRQTIHARFEKHLAVEFVRQELTDLPTGFSAWTAQLPRHKGLIKPMPVSGPGFSRAEKPYKNGSGALASGRS